jgi:hypothetical protein
MGGLRGRINKLEQMVRGDEFSYELPGGEIRTHHRDECVGAYVGAIARIRASEKGEELPQLTPLKVSHMLGEPLSSECPELDKFLPMHLYSNDDLED